MSSRQSHSSDTCCARLRERSGRFGDRVVSEICKVVVLERNQRWKVMTVAMETVSILRPKSPDLNH